MKNEKPPQGRSRSKVPPSQRPKVPPSQRPPESPHPPKEETAPVPRRYAVHAVAADGSRRPLDASHIVVETGGGEIAIDLEVRSPMLDGQLYVEAESGGLLVVGHGDASSIHLSVEPFGKGRLSPS